MRILIALILVICSPTTLAGAASTDVAADSPIGIVANDLTVGNDGKVNLNVQVLAPGTKVEAFRIDNLGGQSSLWRSDAHDAVASPLTVSKNGDILTDGSKKMSYGPLAQTEDSFELSLTDNGAFKDRKTDFRVTLFLADGKRAVCLLKRLEMSDAQNVQLKNTPKVQVQTEAVNAALPQAQVNLSKESAQPSTMNVSSKPAPFALENFDISGFKLGRLRGPELKREIEALPEGYKCFDVIEEKPIGEIFRDGFFQVDGAVKYMGYSCFAPTPLQSPYIRDKRAINQPTDGEFGQSNRVHLLFLFDEDSGKSWYISKQEIFADEKNAPLVDAVMEELVKKYGNHWKTCRGDWYGGLDERNRAICRGWQTYPSIIATIDKRRFGTYQVAGRSSWLPSPHTLIGTDPVIAFSAWIQKGEDNPEATESYMITLVDAQVIYDRVETAIKKTEETQKADAERREVFKPSF